MTDSAGRNYASRSRRARAALWAVAVAFAASSAASAMEFAPLAPFPDEGGDKRKWKFLLGALYAYDSNPSRAEDGDETDDGVVEAVAGLDLKLGGKRAKLGLGVAARMTSHSELSQYDTTETAGTASMSWSTKKLRFAIDGRFAQLSDPVDVDTLSFSILEREESSFKPLVALSLGKVGIVGAMSQSRTEYESGELRDMDHDEVAGQYELWFGRPETRVYYVHVDSSEFDYHTFVAARPRSDFSTTTYYGGLRTGSSRPKSFDIAAGVWSVESDNFTAPDGVYAKAAATMKRKGGTGILRMALESTPAQSPTANLKTSTRGMVSYMSRTNHKWVRTMSLQTEMAEMTDPDPGTAESLAVYMVNLGLQRNLGSPGNWHGQLVMKVDLEIGDSFQRTKASLGFSLAH